MSEKADQGKTESVKPDDAKEEQSEIDDERLDEASGGLLLPAIQKVRQAAARTQTVAVPTNASELVETPEE